LIFSFMILGITQPAAVEDEGGLSVANLTYKPGQFAISALTGTTPEGKLAVKVLRGEEPAAGITVYFELIQTPVKEKGAALKKTEVITDADGIAGTTITLGDRAGKSRVNTNPHAPL
jgi:hypothetical protein